MTNRVMDGISLSFVGQFVQEQDRGVGEEGKANRPWLNALMEHLAPANTMARTGVPVPGQTASAAVTTLIRRAFRPTRAGYAESVLDWAGLDGHPAGPITEVATRHHITRATLTNRIRQVTKRGARRTGGADRMRRIPDNARRSTPTAPFPLVGMPLVISSASKVTVHSRPRPHRRRFCRRTRVVDR